MRCFTLFFICILLDFTNCSKDNEIVTKFALIRSV